MFGTCKEEDGKGKARSLCQGVLWHTVTVVVAMSLCASSVFGRC